MEEEVVGCAVTMLQKSNEKIVSSQPVLQWCRETGQLVTQYF